MAKQVMSLCSVPAVATKDGHTGSDAHFLLPFSTYGYWFASGQRLTFNRSQIAQDTTHKIAGTDMPDVFQKDCCDCING